MAYFIVGLGNPEPDYEGTRHNTGRIVLEKFRKKADFSPWEEDKKKKALTSEGKIKNEKTTLIMPDNYMNNSGKSVAPFITNAKRAESLVVVYDDIDLPLGVMKISFNRGAGGHKGVLSIERAIRTKAFTRVRIGISPKAPKGKIKKPKGDDAVHRFIMGEFTKKEKDILNKISRKAVEALFMIVEEGRERAMNTYN